MKGAVQQGMNNIRLFEIRSGSCVLGKKKSEPSTESRAFFLGGMLRYDV